MVNGGRRTESDLPQEISDAIWGPGCRVLDVEPLKGGLHTETTTVQVCRGGQQLTFVLRLYPSGRLQESLCRNEQAALNGIPGLDVRTPEVLWADPSGIHAGTPAIALERLPGGPLRTCDAGAVAEFADALAEIHAQSPPAGIFRFDRGIPHDVDLPLASVLRARWHLVQQEPDRFLHGDASITNCLWERQSLTGVVDWSHATCGPPTLDLAGAWLELYLFVGNAAARTFLAEYGSKRFIDFDALEGAVALCLSRSRPRLNAWCTALSATQLCVDKTSTLRRHAALYRAVEAGKAVAT